MSTRSVTRRGQPKQYLLERLPTVVAYERRLERPPPAVAALVAAGGMGASLRRALRVQGIDPKLARLVLLFYGGRELRPRDVAWMLNVSRPTASRYLDRAEQLRLVEKRYATVIDRRATHARLTEKGRLLRLQVEATLCAAAPYTQPKGRAYGRRSCDPHDP